MRAFSDKAVSARQLQRHAEKWKGGVAPAAKGRAHYILQVIKDSLIVWFIEVHGV